MRTTERLTMCASLAYFLFGTSQLVFGQTVENAAHFDLSPPLNSIQAPARAQGAFLREHRVKKLPPLPTKAAALADTVLQSAAVIPLSATVSGSLIDGVGNGNYGISSDPPDTNGSVGKSHYVQWVNTGLAVFDKTTRTFVASMPKPINGNLVWAGFGGNCENFNDGDPIVLYDKAADRWLLTQFAVSGTPFSQCFAVSTSGDPTGPYARYEFQFSAFNDYPKFGVWPDGYYGTFNMFSGNSFNGAKACAFERDKMITGQQARMVCFDLAGQGGVLPSDLDGNRPLPAGTPNFMLNFGSDRLNLWRFHVDWLDPSNSTLTGPATIKTAPFEIGCKNATAPGECVSQPNTTEVLDTLSDRLMFRAAYRNFTDHDALVVNHTVAAGAITGIRWYEIRDLAGTPQIFQQGTYAPDGAFRWMASVAMDKAGNMLMGFSVSSPSIFPAIRYTGRSVSDPPNQMAAEQLAVGGTGSQTNPDRWGDYASMSIDPSDDCTFWFSTQYMADTGSFNWRTSIVPVKFSSCQ